VTMGDTVTTAGMRDGSYYDGALEVWEDVKVLPQCTEEEELHLAGDLTERAACLLHNNVDRRHR
jgi:hypothetical protein